MALTDGAIEVLNIAKENLLENCPAALKSDKRKDFGSFSEQSSLQANTVYCEAVGKPAPLSLLVSASSTPVARSTAAAVGRLRWLHWQPRTLLPIDGDGSLPQLLKGSYQHLIYFNAHHC